MRAPPQKRKRAGERERLGEGERERERMRGSPRCSSIAPVPYGAGLFGTAATRASRLNREAGNAPPLRQGR